MAHALARSAMLLTLAACCAGRAFALDPGKWSKVYNDSRKVQVLQISDWQVVVGNVYVKKEKDPGDGTRLSKAKDNLPLEAGTHYLVYFDTTAGGLALTLGIGSGDDRFELNFKRAPGVGDRLVVSPARFMLGTNVVIALAGFRNFDSREPFLRIKDPVNNGIEN
jgi:hypothetical protein